MYLGTNFAQPVIHPTKQIVNHTFSTTVVPHIHPVHTTTVNHHMFQHKHYCPQSVSSAEECCNQHINCCCPGGPGGMPAVAPMATGPGPSNVLPPRPGFAPGGPGMMGPGGPGMMGPGGPGMMGPGGPGMMGPGGPGMMGPGGPGMMAPGGPGMMGPGGPGMMAPGQFPRQRPFWR